MFVLGVSILLVLKTRPGQKELTILGKGCIEEEAHRGVIAFCALEAELGALCPFRPCVA